jgi:hypothetical protein
MPDYWGIPGGTTVVGFRNPSPEPRNPSGVGLTPVGFAPGLTPPGTPPRNPGTPPGLV